MDERLTAVKVLNDVFFKGQHSDTSIRKYETDDSKTSERGLLRELVFGTIQKYRELDYILERLSNVKLKKIEHGVLNLLRISIYQLKYMDKVPKYAVLDEANKISRHLGSGKSKSFVNAILRSYIRKSKDFENMDMTDDIESLSVKYGFPESLIKTLSNEKLNIKKFLEVSNLKPDITVRAVNISKDVLQEKLKDMNYDVQGTILDDFLTVKNPSGIFSTELFKEGYFTVQDIASGFVANAIPIRGDEIVLDLCSAPGGKAIHISSKLTSGKVLACDLNKKRLDLVDENIKRLKISNIYTLVNDATLVKNEWIGKFDVVLADVPCTGFGVIRKKPEIRFRDPSKINELSETAYKILLNAAEYVRPGGYLVFSTCTVCSKENEHQIYEFLKDNNNYRLVKPQKVKMFDGEEFFIRTLPYDGVDGFFISLMERIK